MPRSSWIRPIDNDKVGIDEFDRLSNSRHRISSHQAKIELYCLSGNPQIVLVDAEWLGCDWVDQLLGALCLGFQFLRGVLIKQRATNASVGLSGMAIDRKNGRKLFTNESPILCLDSWIAIVLNGIPKLDFAQGDCRQKERSLLRKG